MVSRAIGTTPLLLIGGGIWLRGHRIAILPAGYRDPRTPSVKLPSPLQLSYLSEGSLTEFTLPTSRDGTRFLICDEGGFPLVVDVSQLITGLSL